MSLKLLALLVCPLALLAEHEEPDRDHPPTPYTVMFGQLKPGYFLDFINDYFQGGCATDGVCWTGEPAGGIGLSSENWIAQIFSHSALGSWAPSDEIPRIVSEGGFTGSVTVTYQHNPSLKSLPLRAVRGKRVLASIDLDQPPYPGGGFWLSRTIQFKGTGNALVFDDATLAPQYSFASIHFSNLRVPVKEEDK